ncbi:MAG: hypothetical protein ACK5HP_04140 [Bacilli bacterium]
MTVFNNNDEVQSFLTKFKVRFADIFLTDTSTTIYDETRHWLKNYSKAYEQYNNAIMKIGNKIYNRNILDDLKLSLELLTRELLNNEKSLENNIDTIFKSLKDKDISTELRSMISTLIDYYSKYQNTYIKHNDNVKSHEIEFIFQLTSSIMQFLIKILGN